jgi:hypothetical protein
MESAGYPNVDHESKINEWQFQQSYERIRISF